MKIALFFFLLGSSVIGRSQLLSLKEGRDSDYCAGKVCRPRPPEFRQQPSSMNKLEITLFIRCISIKFNGIGSQFFRLGSSVVGLPFFPTVRASKKLSIPPLTAINGGKKYIWISFLPKFHLETRWRENQVKIICFTRCVSMNYQDINFQTKFFIGGACCAKTL